MTRTGFPLLLAAVLGLGVAPVASARAVPPAPIEERLGQLEAGDYVWQPELAPDGPVEIVISLPLQRAYVFRAGTLIGVSSVSSGREGHESPIGRFQILEKSRHHRSNRYQGAPMPFMQRLNWYGVALHGGHVPGYPASHGCIRLPMAFARQLFAATEPGTFVFVADEAVESPEAALALARANAAQPMRPDRLPREAMAAR